MSGAPVAEVLKDVLPRERLYGLARGGAHDRGARAAIENLEELVTSPPSTTSPGRSRSARAIFWSKVSLRNPTSTSGPTTRWPRNADDAPQTAKGLEFGIVFIIGCEEGGVPALAGLDEGGLEGARLCYGAASRAGPSAIST